MASRLKHLSGAFVVSFVGGVLLALLLFDSGLRLVEATPLWRILPVVEPIPGQPDRDFGFDATPGAKGIWSKEHRSRIRVNSLGLRDVERDPVKPAGTIRVGLLGDSMVEAMQVSQEATFGALAEHRLRSEGYKVEFINLAIAGPSPLRQLLRLEKRGYALNLDLVLANSASSSFWSGALRDDSQNPGYVEGADGRLVRGYAFRQRFSQRHADDLLGRSFVALYQHSPLVRMLYLRGREPSQLFRVTATQTGSRFSAPITATDPAALCRATATALEPHIGLWMQHQPAREWAATTQFLDEFSQSTAAHGVPVLYAVRDIPLPPSNCPSVDARRAELISIMETEFTRRGMTFVDWSASVAVAAGRRDLEWLHGFGLQRGGGHLNYDGHRAWAVALVDLLKPELTPSHGDRRPAL